MSRCCSSDEVLRRRTSAWPWVSGVSCSPSSCCWWLADQHKLLLEGARKLVDLPRARQKACRRDQTGTSTLLEACLNKLKWSLHVRTQACVHAGSNMHTNARTCTRALTHTCTRARAHTHMDALVHNMHRAHTRTHDTHRGNNAVVEATRSMQRCRTHAQTSS